MILRPYQIKGLSDIKQKYQEGFKRVLYVAPPGAGKTVQICEMCKGVYVKNKRVLFLVHRRTLIDQCSEELSKHELDHGIIASEFPMDLTKAIQIGSVQSVSRRLNKLNNFDLIIADEAHHSISKTWLSIFRHYPDAYMCGLTGSPIRLSSEPLSDVWDSIVLGPTTKELIDQKYLSDYTLYSPPHNINMEGIKKIGGDYERDKLEVETLKSNITGHAVQHYKKYIPGERAIVYCVTVKHSKLVCQQFLDSGIPSAHMDGETPRYLRRQIVENFKSNKINIVCNVDVISEGFNIPSCKAVFLLRKTASLSVWIQQTDRAMRIDPDKNGAIIFDHTSNVYDHGFPDQEREWSLDGIRRRTRETTMPIRRCQNCFAIFPARLNVCQQCHTEYELTPREIKQKEGELQKIERKQIQIHKKREVGMCRDYQSLVRLGQERGYKSPTFWARCIIEAREKKYARRQPM